MRLLKWISWIISPSTSVIVVPSIINFFIDRMYRMLWSKHYILCTSKVVINLGRNRYQECAIRVLIVFHAIFTQKWIMNLPLQFYLCSINNSDFKFLKISSNSLFLTCSKNKQSNTIKHRLNSVWNYLHHYILFIKLCKRGPNGLRSSQTVIISLQTLRLRVQNL